jgi:hypothetical protein
MSKVSVSTVQSIQFVRLLCMKKKEQKKRVETLKPRTFHVSCVVVFLYRVLLIASCYLRILPRKILIIHLAACEVKSEYLNVFLHVSYQ